MFEAAAVKFCKSVGEGTLLPAPSIDTANRCKPFQIIVKKNRRWWSWQSALYEPSPFSLTQLTTENEPLKDIPVTDRNLLSYNKIHKLSIKGKLGSELKSVLDFELDGSDAVDVECKLGNVFKTEVDQTKLMSIIGTRHIDLQHPFIQQTRENPRRVLAVVVGSCWVKDKATISAKRSVSSEEDIHEKTIIIPSAEEEVDVSDEDNKAITLPPGTNIAYSVCELKVAEDGQISLCIGRDSRGEFVSSEDSADGAAASSVPPPEPEVQELLRGVTGLADADRTKLREHVLRMCAYPLDIDTLLVLVKQAHKLTEVGCIAVQKSTNLSVLGSKFLCAQEVWSYVLKMAGFEFLEEEVVNYPQCTSPAMASIQYMYESLIEINDEALMFLSQVTCEYVKPLLHLLTEYLSEKHLKTDDKKLKPLYDEANPALRFVGELGFSADADGDIIPPKGDNKELNGAVRAIYGLFWEPEFSLYEKEKECKIL